VIEAVFANVVDAPGNDIVVGDGPFVLGTRVGSSPFGRGFLKWLARRATTFDREAIRVKAVGGCVAVVVETIETRRSCFDRDARIGARMIVVTVIT